MAPAYGYQKERLRLSTDHWPQISSKRHSIDVRFRKHKRDSLMGLPWQILLNDMAVCFDHADPFKLDHLDPDFHLIIVAESE